MKKLLFAGLLVLSLSFTTSAWALVYSDLLGPTGGGTATNGTSLTVNGAIFTVAPDNTGAGTGAINSFLRLQAQGNSDFEKAYNTDDRSHGSGNNKPEFDALSDPNFTRSVQLGQLPTVTVGAIEYFELIFDMNETQAQDKPLVSLHTLELYVNTATGAASSYAAGLGNLVWTLDFAGNDNRIDLDSGIIGGGSGKYDLIALFPTSLLAPYADNDYFYLYNLLGKVDNIIPPGFPADSGFEEWAFFSQAITPGDGGGPDPDAVVPEPSTIILLGAGLLGLGLANRRKFKR